MAYARVAVNVPNISGVFDYHIPPELEGKIGLGHLVLVPFGKHTVQGVVMELLAQASVADTKPLLERVDADRVLTGVQIEFAKQLAARTLNPLANMVGLMIPAGLNQQADVLYLLTGNYKPNPENLEEYTDLQLRLLLLLQERGPMRGRQIDHAIPHVDWRKPMQVLIKRGLISANSMLPSPKARPKFIRTAQLAVLPMMAEAAMFMDELGRTDAVRERRQKALKFLINEPDMINVSWVYAESGCNLDDLQALEDLGLIVLRETELWRDPLEKIQQELQAQKALQMTTDQQRVWEQVLIGFRERGEGKPADPFLLHGVTGSGKTEIYLRAAAEAVRRGRQVIMLIPEIALTPQTVRRFIARFPGQVGVMHSKLSEGERYDTWRRARNGHLSVIIGPRSALFAPLPNVGLIIVDECHDNSFYQNEPPFYHAVSAAILYAQISGALCILGSATPPVALRALADATLTPAPLPERERESEGRVRVLSLPTRLTPRADGSVIEGAPLPPVSSVDMRAELKAGNRGIFSGALLEALRDTLARGEQAILYLNRRGTATYVFCRECGYTVKCPRCEAPMTMHVEQQAARLADATSPTQPLSFDLTCHRCSYKRQVPKKCPACGGMNIRAYGLGSEKVEQEFLAHFPHARALRWDWETTREKNAHEIILTHFTAHNADVLIGTQMLAKGLDLPLVTLVGIVLADVGLNLPDPFAEERTFQLLTQVAGRAGRSERGGRVIMQTFQPEHPVIRFAAAHDYAGFSVREIAQRKQLGYPPFARLARLEFRHQDGAAVESQVTRLAARLAEDIKTFKLAETELIGPAPCFFAKVNGQYRWQVIVRGPQPEALVRNLKLIDGWRVEVEPVNLL